MEALCVMYKASMPAAYTSYPLRDYGSGVTLTKCQNGWPWAGLQSAARFLLTYHDIKVYNIQARLRAASEALKCWKGPGTRPCESRKVPQPFL
jgi:hypothetical protein